MDKNIKKKWTEALRSGKFVQGKMSLKRKLDAETEFRYCCLGVLCEVLTEVNPDVTFEVAENDPNYQRVVYKTSKSGINLPWDLRGVVGIFPVVETTLVEMNDDEGKTFAEIADWIDDNL